MSNVAGRTVVTIGGQVANVNKVTPICYVPLRSTATLNIQLFSAPGGSRVRSIGTGSSGSSPPSSSADVTSSAQSDSSVATPSGQQSFIVNEIQTSQYDESDNGSILSTGNDNSISSSTADRRVSPAMTSSETMTDPFALPLVADGRASQHSAMTSTSDDRGIIYSDVTTSTHSIPLTSDMAAQVGFSVSDLYGRQATTVALSGTSATDSSSSGMSSMTDSHLEQGFVQEDRSAKWTTGTSNTGTSTVMVDEHLKQDALLSDSLEPDRSKKWTTETSNTGTSTVMVDEHLKQGALLSDSLEPDRSTKWTTETSNTGTSTVMVGEHHKQDALLADRVTSVSSPRSFPDSSKSTSSSYSTNSITRGNYAGSISRSSSSSTDGRLSAVMTSSEVMTDRLSTSSYRQVDEQSADGDVDYSDSRHGNRDDHDVLPSDDKWGTHRSYNTLKYSTFRFFSWDVMNALKDALHHRCHRVLVYKDPSVVLIFKASCDSERAGNDRRLLHLMGDIAENCAKRLSLMQDIKRPDSLSKHMDTLPLNDGRITSEHLAEISDILGEEISITDVAFRYQPTDPSIYIGSSVQGIITSNPRYAIGSVGVVTVLTKKNKYATVEAFSEQLCEHIARARPTELGAFEGDRQAGRASQCRRVHPTQDMLLLQSFKHDPTIIVAEAARRCFVSIDDFLLFD